MRRRSRVSRWSNIRFETIFCCGGPARPGRPANPPPPHETWECAGSATCCPITVTKPCLNSAGVRRDALRGFFDTHIRKDWWRNSAIDIRIGLFWSISSLILGGEDDSDIFGNRPLQTVFVETDGSIEGLDVLRVCENGMTATGLERQTSRLRAGREIGPFHGPVIFSGLELPSGCRGCPEQNTCGGGYLPHRYSRERMFDNPSIWCADILRLFGTIRKRLGVPPESTARRREVLSKLKDRLSGDIR